MLVQHLLVRLLYTTFISEISEIALFYVLHV